MAPAPRRHGALVIPSVDDAYPNLEMLLYEKPGNLVARPTGSAAVLADLSRWWP